MWKTVTDLLALAKGAKNGYSIIKTVMEDKIRKVI